MNYWLIKSEPNAYSIEDLEQEKIACWDGVRNYQARNIMRDQMKVGDTLLFYHSNANPSGIVGVAKVCRTAYPDHTALDPSSKYFDPKSSQENPRWWMVDVEFIKKYSKIISLEDLRQTPGLEDMYVLRKGARLSVQPVSANEFQIIEKLAKD